MNDIFIKLGEVRMNEWISIIAVLMSPLIAVCVTMLLEKRRQRRKDKMELFQVLMTQRGINESYAWVNALNSIHIIFSSSTIATLTISSPLYPHNIITLHLFQQII